MNRSILASQLWEFWRRTRNDLLQRVLIVVFLVALIHGGFYLLVDGGLENEVFEPVMSLVFGLVLLGAVVPMSLSASNMNALGIQGVIRSQFVQPARTTQMIVVPLALGLLMSAVYLAGTLLFLRLALGLEYSIPVTMLVALPVAMTLHACAIGTRNAGSFLGMLGPLGGLYAFGVFSIPETMNFPLGTPEEWGQIMSITDKGYFLLYGVAFLSVPIAHWSVDRMRHGAVASEDVALPTPLFGGGKAPHHRQPFASYLRAQWWFEMRRVAGHTAVNVGSGLSLFVVLVVGMELGLFPPQHFNGALLLLLLISQFGILMGNVERVSGMSGQSNARRFSVFEATQGIGVAQGLRVKIYVVAITSFVGSVPLAGAAAFLVSRYPTEATTLKFDAIYAWLIIMAGSPKAWMAAMGIVPMCMLTVVLLSFYLVYLQRRASARVDIAITACSVTLIPAYGILFLLDRMRDWDLSIFWAVHAWAIGTYALFLAIRGLWRAWRHELLGLPALLSAIGVWCVFVSTVIWALSILRPDITFSVAMSKLHLVVFFAGLLSIPLGSVAWAPLALDRQRSQ